MRSVNSLMLNHNNSQLYSNKVSTGKSSMPIKAEVVEADKVGEETDEENTEMTRIEGKIVVLQ